MPMNSAIAGRTATTSMTRQTPGCSPQTLKMIALMMNAANWPLTIITSLRVTMPPRRSTGATSARYTGTVAEAPPTARPSTNRKAARIGQLGESTHPSVARPNTTASMMMLWRRPNRSDSAPPTMAPMAAPKIRMLTTTPSVNEVSPRSALRGLSAPLMTPVS